MLTVTNARRPQIPAIRAGTDNTRRSRSVSTINTSFGSRTARSAAGTRAGTSARTLAPAFDSRSRKERSEPRVACCTVEADRLGRLGDHQLESREEYGGGIVGVGDHHRDVDLLGGQAADER